MLDKKKRRSRGRGIRVEDVAREAGVSPITVSRALGNPSKVKPETRTRVAEAVAKTGYILNNSAASLRSGRSTIVPVFVSNLQNPHFSQAMQGCADALEGSKFHLLMAQTGYSDVLQQDIVESVLPFRPAALIFTGLVHSEHTRSTLKRLALPVMEMWDYTPDPIDMLVGFSNSAGGKLMGEHFGKMRCSRIAYAGRTQDRGAHRLQGFREGLAAYGKTVDFVLPLEGSRSISDGKEALARIASEFPGCDAIFFGTDILAIGATLHAKTLGISVPEDIAIAGYGDLELSRQLSPPLTTIHVFGYQMGVLAGEMLLRRLRNEPIGEKVILHPISLEARETTARALK